MVQEVLLENKLFSSNQVEQIVNRLKDNPDKTRKQLAIFGLFRQQPPFNQIKDVNQLQSRDQLRDMVIQWFDKTIDEMVKTKEFIDNKDLATKYLVAYMDNVNSLGANARPFSMRNIEKELVDVVLNHGWIKEDREKKAVGIYEPNDSDVIYKDDDIWIMRGDTKAKCVLYGQGQKWCISRADLNFYNTYRIQYGATIYFCMQPNVQGDEHTFVILNYGDNQYGLADQTNDGKRSGGPNEAISWSQVEREIPNLKGKESNFKHIPVTKEEKKYTDLIAKKFNGDDLGGYILDKTNSLVVHGARVSPVDFIRDYVAHGNEVAESQFPSLTPEMLDSLIEIGYSFNSWTFTYLTEAQKRRAATIDFNAKSPNLENLYFFIFEYLSPENKQKCISRMMFAGGITDKHYAYMSDEQKDKHLTMKVTGANIFKLSDFEFGMLPEILKTQQVKRLMRRQSPMFVSDVIFDFMNYDLQKLYVDALGYGSIKIPDSQFIKLPDNLKQEYLSSKIQYGSSVTDEQFIYIPDNRKREYIQNMRAGEKINLFRTSEAQGNWTRDNNLDKDGFGYALQKESEKSRLQTLSGIKK